MRFASSGGVSADLRARSRSLSSSARTSLAERSAASRPRTLLLDPPDEIGRRRRRRLLGALPLQLGAHLLDGPLCALPDLLGIGRPLERLLARLVSRSPGRTLALQLLAGLARGPLGGVQRRGMGRRRCGGRGLARRADGAQLRERAAEPRRHANRDKRHGGEAAQHRAPSAARGRRRRLGRRQGHRERALPRVVGPERPEVALGVTAGVATPAEIVVLHGQDDLRAGRLRPGMVGVRVRHHEIGALRLRPADLVGLLHEFLDRRVADRRQHQQGAAEGELRIERAAGIVGEDRLLLEAESRAQPICRRRNVAVAHGGCGSRHGRQLFLLCPLHAPLPPCRWTTHRPIQCKCAL